jgi:phosphoribosyl-ATP pyrophosphohydrolase/phosphoribosyl-AMP cyclohydrolase
LDYGKVVDPVSGEQLVPVVVVDSGALATDGLSAFRMQAFANRAAVEVTLDSGLATFYSRTRGELWTKGLESGNVLRVLGAYADCDWDCLLLDVEPAGPTCHDGTNSCFEVNTVGE